MAETNPSGSGCQGVCCTVVGIGLIIFGVIILISIFGGGSSSSDNDAPNLRDPEDIAVCNAIAGNQPYMMPVKGVTLLRKGSAARMDCRVVKSGPIKDEKTFWTGPGFAAGGKISVIKQFTNIQTFQAQKGIHVTGELSWAKSFDCGRKDRVSPPITTLTLFFDPVLPEHTGLYTCTSNFTATDTIESRNLVVGNAYFLDEKIYLTVI